MMTLGEIIRDRRTSKGMSLRKLAKLCAITAPYLSDIELGRRLPSASVQESIGGCLGLSPFLLPRLVQHEKAEALRRKYEAMTGKKI